MKRAALSRYWKALRRERLAMTAALALAIVVAVAVIMPFIMGDLATHQDFAFSSRAPGWGEMGVWGLLGTDSLGRSLLARLIVASRTTLLIAASAVVISASVGTLIGTTIGYFGGWTEAVAMRLADVIMSFPSLLLALIVLYVIGPEAWLIVLVLSIARIPVYLRSSRALARELRDVSYVEAARGLGLSRWRIVGRHGLPAVLPNTLALVTVEFGLVMLIESSLSFLGIGVQPPAVSWGLMAADGRGYLQTAWWLSFFPGLAICLTVIGINIVSNWIRLVRDPKQQWRFFSPLTSAEEEA
jgi:peptide/nickel transport system permease protein